MLAVAVCHTKILKELARTLDTNRRKEEDDPGGSPVARHRPGRHVQQAKAKWAIIKILSECFR